ncbi:precorrin-3B synthase [Ancylobacter terrae]|uniref:precorrin-3B synthase n=1 Tax=Ancylobacter sp. sgz301288 TaxID=3342077 RepID=UPI00385A2880
MSPAQVIPARRRGACPSLPEPMATGDGLLARLVPAEPLTPAQLAGLARASREHGNGLIEVTARGSLQVRGLSAASAPDFAAAVADLGIIVREGPVQANPLAGRLDGMAFDPRPLAAAIARLAAPLAGRLAPKLSVIVDGGGRLGLDGLAADIRVTAAAGTATERGAREAPALARGPHLAEELALAAGDADEAGTRLLLVSLAATPLGCVRAVDAAEAVGRLLDLLAARGREARGRDVPAVEALAALVGVVAPLAEARPPAFAIAGAGNGAAPVAMGEAGGGREADRADRRGGADRPATGDIAARSPAVAAGHAGAGPAPAACEPLAIHPLRDGRVALGIGLAFGQSDSAALESLADAARRAGADAIEPAPGRALLVAGLAPEAGEALRAAAAALGFITDAADPRRRVFACPGSPACASALLPARAIAAELAAFAAAGTVHVSGCAKGCAHPSAADVTIVGLDAGAGLVVEGSARAIPARIVPRAQIVAAARQVLETPRG